jgi:hypothetical protein
MYVLYSQQIYTHGSGFVYPWDRESHKEETSEHRRFVPLKRLGAGDRGEGGGCRKWQARVGLNVVCVHITSSTHSTRNWKSNNKIHLWVVSDHTELTRSIKQTISASY